MIRTPISMADFKIEEHSDIASMDYCKWPDLRRKVQPTQELQQTVNQRKERVNQLLSDIKRGNIPKEKMIKHG